MKIPSILTIAGSDSSSGAGIQADCAVARNMQVFPFCAVTCVTSQGKSGLRRIQVTDPEVFRDQLTVAFEEYKPDAVKIGLLPSSLKPILIEMLKKYRPKNVVLDPIKAPTMIADGAEEISFGWTQEELEENGELFYVITPNLPEAYEFMGWDYPGNILTSKIYKMSIYHLLHLKFPIPYIYLKGGHADIEEGIVDTLIQNPPDRQGESRRIPIFHKRVKTNNTHGTGCALSAALATQLALGTSTIEKAAKYAMAQVVTGMELNEFNTFTPDREYPGPAYFYI